MSRFRPPVWNGVPIPYEGSIEVLRGAIRSPGPSAWAAFRALAEKAGPEAMAVLAEFAGHPDAYLRRAAVEAIGLHADGRSASEVVLAALDDPHDAVVRAGCSASAQLGLVDAHDRVLRLVRATDEATRLAALQALKELWSSSDFAEVFARYLRDPSDRVRKEAAWVLNDRIGPEHWEAVFAAWSRDEIPRHRAWACDLAGRFGGPSTRNDLGPLLHDVDGHVRHAARRAVARIDA